MSISAETALHRLRVLYRDAHHCDPPTDDHALQWAANPELWAEYQIRFRNWSWYATEATVREARKLNNRLQVAGLPVQQDAEQ